nr:hypothetical protein [Kibdelosporangium sp. MJ126-NF4]CEL15648.1 High-affnity carbon uptake protein Hat/HatR [Kibdelosporangium sp. MJ126-NF4]
MTTRPGALSLIDTRVLLVGNGTHSGRSSLPSLPSVADAVTELGRVLVSECGLDPANLRSLIDPDDPLEFGQTLRESADQAADVLLLYYMGHALISPSGELYLATHSTQDHSHGLAYDAVPYSMVKDMLSACRARSMVVILDCAVQEDAPTDIIGARAAVPGAYVLVSLSDGRNEFTTELTRLLSTGHPAAPSTITLEDVYTHLSQALPAEGQARPVRHSAGDAGSLVLATNEASQGEMPRQAPSSPYPGLSAFTAEDASFFFGREHLVARLLDKVTSVPPGELVAVVGQAGSGKSSMLRAGLIPALRARSIAHAVLVPGAQPVAELDRVLELGLPSRSVLIVDQFEELFTLTQPEAREEFLTRLTGRIADDCVVVFAVREDFSGRCAETHPAVRQSLRDNAVHVDPMSKEELRAAIVLPAADRGLRLEPGLVELLLSDLGVDDSDDASTDALPLLAHTLRLIWARRRGDVLTVEAYQEIGGFRSTLLQTADQLYDRLSEEDQRIMRAVLLQLVEFSADGTVRRRRARIDDLPTAGRVLDWMTSSRLLALSSDYAELIHDTVLGWPRLRQWITEERELLESVQELREQADRWEANDRHRGYLLVHPGFATELAGRVHLSATAHEFIKASQRESRFAQRRRVRRKLTFFVLAVLSLAAAVAIAATVTVWDRLGSEVGAAEVRLTAGTIAQQAESIRASDPRASMLLAVAAWRTSPTADAVSALLSAQGIGDSGVLLRRNGPITAMTTSGSSVAVGETSGNVTLWSPAGTKEVSAAGSVRSIAYAPDGRVLAVASDNAVQFFDLADQPVQRAALQGGAVGVAFSADGRTFATTDKSQTRIWDLTDPVTPRATATWPGAAKVSFGPDGRLFATAGNGEVVVSDAVSGQRSVTRVLRDAQDVTFGNRGLVAAGGADKSVAWLSLDESGRVAQAFTYTGHTGSVLTVAQGDDLIVSGSVDNTVQVLRMGDPPGLVRTATLLGHTGVVTAVAVTADGKVASAGTDGTVRLWDLDPRRTADHLCKAAGGDLSTEQWARYLPDVPYRSACD